MRNTTVMYHISLIATYYALMSGSTVGILLAVGSVALSLITSMLVLHRTMSKPATMQHIYTKRGISYPTVTFLSILTQLCLLFFPIYTVGFAFILLIFTPHLYIALNPAWFALGYVPEIRLPYDERTWMVVFRRPGDDPRELMSVSVFDDVVLLVQ